MRMRKLCRELWVWVPPIALMALIFVLSATPARDEDHGLLYVLSRKAGHFVGYALLLALWWRALASKLSERRALSAALAITVLYAVTDELHQTFVSGRSGHPMDVGIDAAGALAAAALIVRARLRGKVGA
jgi:VanZ family protein